MLSPGADGEGPCFLLHQRTASFPLQPGPKAQGENWGGREGSLEKKENEYCKETKALLRLRGVSLPFTRASQLPGKGRGIPSLWSLFSIYCTFVSSLPFPPLVLPFVVSLTAAACACVVQLALVLRP